MSILNVELLRSKGRVRFQALLGEGREGLDTIRDFWRGSESITQKVC